MVSATLPFMVSMLLGRTIDLTTYKTGANIYDDAKYKETAINQLTTAYSIIGDTIPYDFYGVPVDIALRIKANQLSSISGPMGLDGLLKDATWLHNSVAVAASAVYQTVQRSLPVDAELLGDWRTRIPRNQTHYASSVIYGGWFVLLYRFQCDIPSDAISVRKNVIEVLGTHGTLQQNTLELWNLVRQKVMSNQDVRGMVTVDTFVFSSVELPVQLNSPKDVEKLLEKFPEAIGAVGAPMHMVLKPLAELDLTYPTVEKFEEQNKDLLLLDKMFDDLRYTRARIVKWVKESDGIDEEEEEDVANLLDKVTETVRTFFLLISDVSLYKDDDGDRIRRAIQVYRNGLSDVAETYYIAYLRLKEDIDMSCEDKFFHGITGLLKVYPGESIYAGEVSSDGISECKRKCLSDLRCKAIGYADQIVEFDFDSGNYIRKRNQCWVYHRSTSTAVVHTPNGFSGDFKVYDRQCL